MIGLAKSQNAKKQRDRVEQVAPCTSGKRHPRNGDGAASTTASKRCRGTHWEAEDAPATWATAEHEHRGRRHSRSAPTSRRPAATSIDRTKEFDKADEARDDHLRLVRLHTTAVPPQYPRRVRSRRSAPRRLSRGQPEARRRGCGPPRELLATEVAVGCRLAVDRAPSRSGPRYAERSRVKDLADRVGDALLGKSGGAEGIDGKADQACSSNRVSQLSPQRWATPAATTFLATQQGGVRRGAINLRGILSGERATRPWRAMPP